MSDPEIARDLTFLSRKHAVILKERGVYRIRDEGSLNGTEVNGRVVPKAGVTLVHGDNIRFAISLRYVFENTEEQIAGPELILEPLVDGIGRIIFTNYPAIIERGCFSGQSFIKGVDKENGSRVAENLARITWQGDSWCIENLLGLEGFLINDDRLAGGKGRTQRRLGIVPDT